MTDFTTSLKNRPWLLADGATGTNYFSMGLMSGDAPELWNEPPAVRVAKLHRQFIDAGSDIILTNSFGGSRYRLKLHQAENRAMELNQIAAEIARNEADKTDRPVFVAGSMGPTGEILEPYGELTHGDAVEAFAEQAAGLAAGGADVLWLETLSSQEELAAGVEGARTTGLPIVATLSFDTNGSTMMGVSPTDAVTIMESFEPSLFAFGTNCGVGAAEVVACITAMRRAASESSVLVAKANCGVPKFVDGEICYDGTPELMGKYAQLARDAGARIIGGCCGTTPDHVRHMREILERESAGTSPDSETIVAMLGEITRGALEACTGQISASSGAPRRARGSRRRRG